MQAINQRTGVGIFSGQMPCLRDMPWRTRGGLAAGGGAGRYRVRVTLGCQPVNVPVQSNPRDGLQSVAGNLFSWMVHRYD